MIEIVAPGILATVQDLGRLSHLSIGVGRSGAMDTLALRLGNLLLGNAPGEAGIEFTIGGFAVRFEENVNFALTGADCGATLDGAPVPPFWRMGARAGQVLRARTAERGMRAYLTLAGGLDIPSVLGSASTDLKGGFGGLNGRGLKAGDRIGTKPPLGAAVPSSVEFGLDVEAAFGQAEGIGQGAEAERATVLRVLPGPEIDLLTAPAREAFWNETWTVSPDSNRIGYRLAGPILAMSRRVELLSHGILPGVIQLPPSGQPMIQLSEANTCGGYPKIGTVIGADLPKIGQARLGGTLRFRPATRDEAVAALREQAAILDALALKARALERMLA